MSFRASMLTGVILCLGCLGVDAAETANPPVPVPPSPVARFRQLLTANASDRARLLAEHPDLQRPSVAAKLKEYEALPEQERELRLQATELRFYLRPLLGQEPAMASAGLALVPPDLRPVVQERLTQWHALPETTRHELLEFEQAMSYQVGQSKRAHPTPPLPPGFQPGRVNPALEDQLARWQALPQGRRDAMCRQFEDFFALSMRQRERTLSQLSDEERHQMETVLKAFERLPPEQRRVCVQSFRRFAGLSPAERSEFLRSADRWREMSPGERAQWRQIVTRLPPLPPLPKPTPPLPPPPAAAAQANR